MEGESALEPHFLGNLMPNINLAAQKVRFHLLTRLNPNVSQEIINGNVASLGNYDKTKRTILLTHGYTDSTNASVLIPQIGQFCASLKNDFLKNYDVNVILVNWDADALNIYTTAYLKVPDIGKQIASFIDWLVSQGSTPALFHLVGHSMGAQISGSAGRQVKSGKVGYITGLDPAKPLFENTSKCLNRNDAAYVELIHTATTFWGVTNAYGHNDFYPNGGRNMPGCVMLDYLCSHNRAHEYFLESLRNPAAFLSNQCTNYQEIASNTCSNLSTLTMGGITPKAPRGVFYLKTNPSSPYSKN